MGLLNEKAKGRNPSQEEQTHYKTMVVEALKSITSPQGEQMLREMVQSMGAAKAIAEIVRSTLGGLGTSASMSGVAVAGHTAGAVAKEVVGVLVGLLMQADMLQDDPRQVMQAALQELGV